MFYTSNNSKAKKNIEILINIQVWLKIFIQKRENTISPKKFSKRPQQGQYSSQLKKSLLLLYSQRVCQSFDFDRIHEIKKSHKSMLFSNLHMAVFPQCDY